MLSNDVGLVFVDKGALVRLLMRGGGEATGVEGLEGKLAVEFVSFEYI